MTVKVQYKISYELGDVVIPNTPWWKFPKTKKEFVWKLIKHTVGSRYVLSNHFLDYGDYEVYVDEIEVLMESESKLLLEIHLKYLKENSL